ncbi:FUSC family protein [Pedobacter sandarakinus]|uniref:FUSC family protein n=1 Tax=Pedobacter sandarakinus TaxID=353156 RepID=UPI0022480562|nr:FUSC family membrane protein [Pedobacter sandarakinus]MCX2574900.1 FUSC family protein [Pedobacter sandarakinus]
MSKPKEENFIPLFLDKCKSIFNEIFHGEYVSDAVRNTLAIIVPLVIFIYFGSVATGISISIGALFISLCDIAGNRRDKIIGSLISIVAFGLTSFLIAISFNHSYLVGLFVVVLTFIFAMFSVFGNRLSVIGLMGTAMIAFTLGLHPQNPIMFSIYITIGAIWYAIISLIQVFLKPYRSLHHAIFQALNETAALMRLRANAYRDTVSSRDFNTQNITLHLKLNARQELIRSLLLRDRIAMSPGNYEGHKLLGAALDIIDLYEQVTAIHYDYADIRKVLSDSGSLTKITGVIDALADKLEKSAFCFAKQKGANQAQQYEDDISIDLNEITQLSTQLSDDERHLLAPVIRNLIEVTAIINRLYQGHQHHLPDADWIENNIYKDFIPDSGFSWQNFGQHFSLRSPTFRFALRLSLLCLIAVLPTLIFPEQRYSYWLLLTVVIVNRPSFGLTRKRNTERLWGTLIGLCIGLILALTNTSFQLGLAVAGLLGFFIFNRTHYLWGVACVTVMVILGLNVYHGHVSQIIADRLLFTLIGCGLSYVSIFIFPIWESARISALINNMLVAIHHYLFCVATEKKGFLNYYYRTKLARKEAYVSFSLLSEALQSVKKEPAARSLDLAALEDIQWLSYQINGVIASLSLNEIDENVGLATDFELALEDLDRAVINAEMINLNHFSVAEFSHQAPRALLNRLTQRLSSYFN